MRVAYLTTDEVNRNLARGLAAACGAALHPVTPRDDPPDGSIDAVLYDLDFLSVTHRQEILAALKAGASPHVAGVHSYGLDENVVNALRKHHVVVSRRLDGKLFRKLRRQFAPRDSSGEAGR